MEQQIKKTDLVEAILEATLKGYVVSYRRMLNGDLSVRVSMNLNRNAVVNKAVVNHIRNAYEMEDSALSALLAIKVSKMTVQLSNM